MKNTHLNTQTNSNTNNPTNDAYWQALGFPKRPKDWKKRLGGFESRRSLKKDVRRDEGDISDFYWNSMSKDDY